MIFHYDHIMIIIVFVMFLSALIRATFGFGNALVAMPLLALVLDLKSAAPLVALAALVIGVLILSGSWRHIEYKSAWRLIVSTFAGMPIGLFLLKSNDDSILKIVLAVCIILFACYFLFHPRLITLRTHRYSYLFGFIGGVLLAAYNTNGPVVVMYGSMRRWNPAQFRATLQGYLFPTALMVVAGHGVSGLWTSEVLQYFLVSLPFVLVAVLLGNRLNRIIPKAVFQKWIYILLLCSGIILLVQMFFL